MNEHTTEIQQKVMADIESGRIKLRSRFVFFAEKLGLGSAVVLSIFVAVVVCTLVLFYVSTSDALAYLGFGQSGWFAFLDAFPYGLVLSLLAVILLAGFLLKKTDLVYRYSYGYVALGLLLVVVAGGGALAATSVAEKIESQTFIRPLVSRSLEKRTYGVMGRILEVAPMTVLLQTSQGMLVVHLEYAVKPLPTLEPGLYVVTIGKMRPPEFWADRVRVISPHEARMLRREIIERHGADVFGGPKMK